MGFVLMRKLSQFIIISTTEIFLQVLVYNFTTTYKCRFEHGFFLAIFNSYNVVYLKSDLSIRQSWQNLSSLFGEISKYVLSKM
jgi:hypothetical protein